MPDSEQQEEEPQPAKVEDEPQPVKVDDYPDRPYWDALSDEHRAVLAEAGQLPPKPSDD